MADQDPCEGCRELTSTGALRPWCQRGAEYGGVGCVRLTPRGPGRGGVEWIGDLPARGQPRRQARKGGRR